MIRFSSTREPGASCTACTKLTPEDHDALHALAVERDLSDYELTRRILPQLTAFPVHLIGWDPLDYSGSGMLRTGIVLVILLALSFAIGIWWNRRIFLKSAAAFYMIFIFFYTTVFTNIHGFFTGIIGGLGYWLSQQSVQRGGQPVYYYALIQLPVYEFAAIAGTVLALVIAFKKRRFWTVPGEMLSETEEDRVIFIPETEETVLPEEEPVSFAEGPAGETAADLISDSDAGPAEEGSAAADEAALPAEEPEKILPAENKIPVLLFLVYWSLSSLIAYSIAGEKMPWLTVHIAMPLALSAAWGFGYLIEVLSWKKLFSKDGLLGGLGLLISVFAVCGMIGVFNSIPQPFAGKDLEQLRATFRFVTVLLFLTAGILMVSHYWKKWRIKAVFEVLSFLLMVLLIVLQTRTAFVSSFIKYDYASELLTYAHGGPGSKTAFEMIADIGTRTGLGKTISVAYDNDTNYPYWWYLRDYTNKKYFGDENPTRDLRTYDIITANTSKDSRLEPIVRDGYYRYEFIRLWWPNQDYFNLTPARIFNALSDPDMRAALFKIWLDRDYSQYAAVTGKQSSLTNVVNNGNGWENPCCMILIDNDASATYNISIKMENAADTGILLAFGYCD